MSLTKKIISKSEFRPFIKEGMIEIAAIVKRTLGPGGNIILMERQGVSLDGSALAPQITKDGVSVAEQCASADPIKDLVIQTIKNICKKTNNTAGDGTTTAIVLGEALLIEFFNELDLHPELNPQLVKEELEIEVKKVIKQLKKMAKKVNNPKVIRQVATISANGDAEIGEIIGQAFDHVGAEGVVTVDEGHTNGVTLEKIQGYQFNRGAEGRDRFFNMNGTHFEAQNAEIIIYDDKLLNYTDLMTPLSAIAQMDANGRPGRQLPPIIVIANEFSNEVIQFLILQKIEMGLQFCAVKGPHTTNVRSGYYEDLAVLLGGTKFGNGGRALSTFTAEDAGLAGRVVIDKYKTTIYEGAGSDDSILNRVDSLKLQKTSAESPYDTQILNDRIASLTSGIAKIGVGGSTDLEIKEKYDRIEDALNAARASIEEGIVPGGGATLFKMSHEIKLVNAGSRILQRALSAPLKQILENIGEELTNEISKGILENKNHTYNARTKELVHAFKAGVIDPVKVTRLALENACSIAGLLATSGGAVIFVKKD